MPFSVRGYIGSFWCDMVDKGMSDILLGRPWQFGRNVSNDGHTNCYSFNLSKRMIKLTPFLIHTSPRIIGVHVKSCSFMKAALHGRTLSRLGG